MNEGEFKSCGALAFEVAKMRGAIEGGATVYLEWSTEKKRTAQQQKAIEVYCREVAKELMNRGIDKKRYFEKLRRDGVDIPWDQDGVKDDIWRIIQIELLHKESTARLEPSEVSQVFDVMNRFLIDRFSFSVQFPDRFSS